MQDLISATIVVFNPKLDNIQKHIASMLDSLCVVTAHFKQSCCLYIVDNSVVDTHKVALKAFLDEKQALMSEVTIHYKELEKNEGYGHANNAVLAELNSKYHIALNPDILIKDNDLITAVNYLNQFQDVGLLSPAVYSPEGDQQFFCKQNPTFFIMFLRSMAPTFIKKLFQGHLNKFEMQDIDYQDIHFNIPFLSGCFLFFRTEIFKKLNGFDPRYFLYFEDADISRRTLALAKSVYNPNVRVIHEWSRGAHHNPYLRKLAIKSGMQYCFKWMWTKG